MSPGPRPSYLRAKFRLDPYNHLATILQRHIQTRQTDRQTDRQDNGLIAFSEPFYKWSPKNGSPYPIGPLSVCPVVSVYDAGV